MPKARWALLHGFCSKFHTLLSLQKFWKSVKIWQSYKEFKNGNFFLRHSVLFWLCNMKLSSNIFSWSFTQSLKLFARIAVVLGQSSPPVSWQSLLRELFASVKLSPTYTAHSTLLLPCTVTHNIVHNNHKQSPGV